MTIYVGDTLTATAATVAGDPTPSRTWQWLRNGTAISGATSNVYTVQGADEGAVLSVRQTETNLLGSASATSAETATVLFSPAALFESSELGAWYDPSDLTTMWTDTAGTTQAGVGDEVARIDDKSGNGNHATQATFAARPILRQTGGGLYYLEFDGTDDFLTIGSGFSPAATEDWGLFFGANLVNPTVSNAAQIISPTTGGTDEGVRANLSEFTTATRDFFTNNATVNTSRLDASSVTLPASFGTGAHVFSLEIEVAAQSANQHEIGRNVNNTNHFDGNLFGLIARGAVSTSQEISNTESYLAAKSGVTLP